MWLSDTPLFFNQSENRLNSKYDLPLRLTPAMIFIIPLWRLSITLSRYVFRSILIMRFRNSVISYVFSEYKDTGIIPNVQTFNAYRKKNTLLRGIASRE